MSKKELFLCLIIICLTAIFLIPFISRRPDSLEKLSKNTMPPENNPAGFIWNAPLPEYNFLGLTNEKLSLAIAAIIGILTVFTLTYLSMTIIKKKRTQ